MFAARGGFFSAGNSNVSGGTVTTDGAYTIRTFTSNGSLYSSRNIVMDYLIVGAGGNSMGHTGGAGGGNVATGSFTAGGTYTITIGQGDTGNGISSISTALFANKGSDGIGRTGGNSMTFTGGTGVSGVFSAGGGGAGAGQNGFNATTIVISGTTYGVGGSGGNGVVSNISGANTYYAGGGGGYSSASGGNVVGGLGGGGLPSNGGVNNANGTPNTGGGGGSGGGPGTTGTGGSGIIIVKYLTPPI